MTTVPPDPKVLREFLLGSLPPSELDALERYLDEHPEFGPKLDDLRVDDTLLAALRDSTRVYVPDSPELDRFFANLDGFLAQVARTDDAPTAGASGPPADDSDADLVALLAPPQGTDELGRLGDYRVRRVLRRGGMGAVFEAEDGALGRRVALKVMLPRVAADPTARKRFLQEARTVATVEHDHIVPIYQVGEDRGVPFLAMPLLQGETLDARLDGPAPLPAAEVLLIGRQLADGLAAAHAAGLIHRDIKPSNVWLERDSDGTFKRVRILDFGLAKSRSPGDAQLTHSGAVLGTPSYMAPEQAAGNPIDHRADLFALGGVLYRMATGRRPFPGTDTYAVLTAIATVQPPPAAAVNPDVPPALSDLIGRLLAKSPDDRPPSAREVADELQVLADPAARPVPAPIARKGRRLVTWAVALLALIPVGLLAVYGTTVVRIVTDRGELIVEVDDPGIEVLVKRDGATLIDRGSRREFVVRAGDGEVVFFDPATGAEAVTKAFRLRAGDKTRVNVRMAEIAAARPKPLPTPKPPLIPAEDAPPPADAFPGKVVYADTFDGPELNDFHVANTAQTVAGFKDGIYSREFPEHPIKRPRGSLTAFGPSPADVAFVLRARVTDLGFSIHFRRLGDIFTQSSHLAFSVHPDGGWDLARDERRKNDQGRLLAIPPKQLRKSEAPEPAFAPGKWFTLTVRSAGTDTVVWVNGRELARVTELPQPQELKASEKGFALGVTFVHQKSCGYALDYLTVWELPLPPKAPAITAGDVPPPADAFPGKVVFADTFDGPELNNFPVANTAQSVAGFKGGVYTYEHPDHPTKRPDWFYHECGPNPRDMAFALRARVTDLVFSVKFRYLRNETRDSHLSFTFQPDGGWELSRGGVEKNEKGQWVKVKPRRLSVSDGPEPALAAGNWFTLAIRSSGEETEVWVNGRLLTRVKEQMPPPAGLANGGKGFGIRGTFIKEKHGGYALDFLTIWELPPPVK